MARSAAWAVVAGCEAVNAAAATTHAAARRRGLLSARAAADPSRRGPKDRPAGGRPGTAMARVPAKGSHKFVKQIALISDAFRYAR